MITQLKFVGIPTTDQDRALKFSQRQPIRALLLMIHWLLANGTRTSP
jgi:hypothetical protein